MCCGLGLEGYIPKPIRPELSEAMWKGVSLVVIFIFCIFNFKKKPFKTGIDRSFTYIVASIFISIGMAYIYHDQTIDIGSKCAFEPVRPDFSFPQDERMPKLFRSYLEMNSKLSKQAFYDEKFKCLDYFVFLEVNKMATSFVMNKMVQR